MLIGNVGTRAAGEFTTPSGRNHSHLRSLIANSPATTLPLSSKLTASWRGAMSKSNSTTQGARIAVLVSIFLLGACASNADKLASASEEKGSTGFEEQTAKTQTPRCRSGYTLTCEANRSTGRIKFGRMKPSSMDSCSCEPEGGMPTNSPLPGIY